MSMQDTNGTHLEDAALLALIDGESTAGEADARVHLESCETCAARLEALRFVDRRVSAALAELDVDPPWSEMPEALRRAAREAATPIESARDGVSIVPRRRPLERWRAVVAAAGLVFVLAVGAAALPGSPVRDFVSRSFDALFGGDAGPTDPGPTQISVDPVGGAVTVSVLGATADLRVVIRRGTSGRAAVSAREARFSVEAGEIRVTDARGDLAVELPAGVEAVVRVDGTEVARSRDGTIERLSGADAVDAAIVIETTG